MSNIDFSLANLRRLLPLRVYATLESYIAEAEVIDFITLAGDVFKIGVLIVWNGQEYRNPCKAGLAMTQGMRVHFGIPDTKSTTFDGWHRLKVIVNDTIVLRLDELLTPDIRRNTVPFLALPTNYDSSGQRLFLDNLNGSSEHLILRSSDFAAPTETSQPMREFDILLPYLTVLSDFCGTANIRDIARAVKALQPEDIAEILDVNAIRMLTNLHRDT